MTAFYNFKNKTKNKKEKHELPLENGRKCSRFLSYCQINIDHYNNNSHRKNFFHQSVNKQFAFVFAGGDDKKYNFHYQICVCV